MIKKILNGGLLFLLLLLASCNQEQKTNPDSDDSKTIIATVLITCSIMALTFSFTYFAKKRPQK